VGIKSSRDPIWAGQNFKIEVLTMLPIIPINHLAAYRISLILLKADAQIFFWSSAAKDRYR
jgi:hypothetical protein